MKVTAFIRKTAKKNDTDSMATIYFRLRDGKKDIKAASELVINPNHWSSEKQGYKDRVALVSEENKLHLSQSVQDIISTISKQYTAEANNEWLAMIIDKYQAYSSFCRLFFCIRCSIAQIAGWLYSEYSKSLYTFAMQSEA